jgi:hypothetical protein
MARVHVASARTTRPMTRSHKTKRWSSGTAAEWMVIRRPGRKFKATGGVLVRLARVPGKLGLGLVSVDAHAKGTTICYLRGVVVTKKARVLMRDYVELSKTKVRAKQAGPRKSPALSAEMQYVYVCIFKHILRVRNTCVCLYISIHLEPPPVVCCKNLIGFLVRLAWPVFQFIARGISFHPMAQCVVHALKGLACRARVPPASLPASHCKHSSAHMSPALHIRGCASPFCA